MTEVYNNSCCTGIVGFRHGLFSRNFRHLASHMEVRCHAFRHTEMWCHTSWCTELRSHTSWRTEMRCHTSWCTKLRRHTSRCTELRNPTWSIGLTCYTWSCSNAFMCPIGRKSVMGFRCRTWCSRMQAFHTDRCRVSKCWSWYMRTMAFRIASSEGIMAIIFHAWPRRIQAINTEQRTPHKGITTWRCHHRCWRILAVSTAGWRAFRTHTWSGRMLSSDRIHRRTITCGIHRFTILAKYTWC